METFCLYYLLVIVEVIVTHPAHENCVAFESSYHVDKGCQCLVFESGGRSQGFFSSANHPLPYPSNLNCILYTFIGDLDEIVEVTFVEFDLQVPLTNRCADVVRLYLDVERPEVSDYAPANYELCGNRSSQTRRQFYSSKRSLIVEFHSDSTQTNCSGFRASYRFLDKGQFEMTSASKRWGAQCTYDFYSNRNSKRGSFFSPLYPQAYPLNCHCQFVFHGQQNERVRLTFSNIQLAGDDYTKGCPSNADSVIVRDGSDGTGHLLALFCGSRRHAPVTSSREQVVVEFRSGDQVEGQGDGQGFAATFEFLPKTEESEAEINSDSVVSDDKNSRDSPFAAFADRPPRPLTSTTAASKSVHPCDEEFSSHVTRNGSFRSPRHPLPYPGHSICRFVFRSRGRERALVVFTEFDLGYPIGNAREPHTCDDVDNVVISVVISGGVRRNYSAFCGSKRPPMLMSSGNRLDVIFTSGPPSNARGFKAEYHFVSDFGITTGEQDMQMLCRFVYRSAGSSNGSFTSPNFPGLYPRNVDCHYIFRGRLHERVSIRFQYFDVDGVPPSCLESTSSDFVELSNFEVDDPSDGRPLTRVCGRKSFHFWRPDVTSDGNFFRVTFRSNDVHDATGFQASYQFTRIEDSYVAGKRVFGSSSSSPSSLNPDVFGQRIIILQQGFIMATVMVSSGFS